MTDTKPTEAELAEADRKHAEAMDVYRRNDARSRQSGRTLGSELVKALGLTDQRVHTLDIHVPVDGPAEVTIGAYVNVSNADIDNIKTELSTYELHRKENDDQAQG